MWNFGKNKVYVKICNMFWWLTIFQQQTTKVDNYEIDKWTHTHTETHSEHLIFSVVVGIARLR